MRKTTFATAAACVLLAAAAACSPQGASDVIYGSSQQAAPTTPAAATSTYKAPPGTPAASASPTPAAVVPLSGAVLTAAALGPGWSSRVSNPAPGPDLFAECGQMSGVGATQRDSQLVFFTGPGRVAVAIRVADYADPAAAKGALAVVSAFLATCPIGQVGDLSETNSVLDVSRTANAAGGRTDVTEADGTLTAERAFWIELAGSRTVEVWAELTEPGAVTGVQLAAFTAAVRDAAVARATGAAAGQVTGPQTFDGASFAPGGVSGVIGAPDGGSVIVPGSGG